MAEYTPPSGPNASGSQQPVPPPSGGYQQPPPQAAYAPPYGSVPPRDRPQFESIPRDVTGKKIAAGVLGILLGSLGVHKFILGYVGAGIITLVISLFTFGTVSGLIGLIEGIVYLTKSDEDFYRTYIVGRRSWF